MKIQHVIILSTLFVTGVTGDAQTLATTAPAYALLPHSETQYAHELFRLNQPSLIAAEAAAAKGTTAEHLWKSELIAENWDAKATASERVARGREYQQEVSAYLDSQATGIDGVWALDQVKFLVAHAAESTLNRMEYWGATAKDRAELGPIAALAERLLKQAAVSLAAGMHDAETKSPFDEAAYTRAFSANAEAAYYATWTEYLQAMAMEVGSDDAARKNLLLAAANALGKWADDKEDNGVNNQSLLLRGKVRSEAGQFDAAEADLNRSATAASSPAWLRYQARNQLIVAGMRAGEFAKATDELAAFRRTLPQGDLDAQLSIDMLAFRIAWMQAAMKPANEQKSARNAAIQILSQVLQRDPRYRELVYEQLATKIPKGADPATLLPLEQLALAFTQSENQNGETPESRTRLMEAAKAAQAVHDTPGISSSDKLEATFLGAVINGMLHNLAAAARFNIEFAEQAPTDPRAKPLLDVALQQLGELRKSEAAIATRPNASDTLTLQLRALTLANETFHDLRWRFAQARTLEELNQLDAAAKIYTAIPVADKTYFDARFRLVAIALAQLNAQGNAHAGADAHAAASALFDACSQFMSLLDHPPAEADKDAVQNARAYRGDIWLIETSVALEPAVRQPQIALDCLAKLDALKAESSTALTGAQQAAMFRYRIEAYQLNGQPDKALAALQDYAAAQGKEPTDVIHAMALSTVDEITRTEKTDPGHAKELARFVVKLLDPPHRSRVKGFQPARDCIRLSEIAGRHAGACRPICGGPGSRH